MMCKLALRNVKRMAKDYVVYFMTMAVVTALMFSFNTLLFSKDVQNLFQMDAMMSVMTGLATAFIVADHCVADQLYGAVCTGKAKP